jgi:nucleoside-triphosphatase THEP1
MELFSVNFKEVVSQMIGIGKWILGTIMLNPNPWTDVIKRQPQVNLITVKRGNYQQVLDILLSWIKVTDSLKL